MTVRSNDVKRVVTEALSASATLRTLVDGRVFGGFPRDPEDATRDYPCVVVMAQGGVGVSPDGEYQQPVLHVWGFSRRSDGEAGAVYDAVRAVLQYERLASGDATVATRVVCRETMGPVSDWDDVTRAWFAHGRWTAQAIG